MKFHLVSSYKMYPHSFLYKRAPRRVPAIYSYSKVLTLETGASLGDVLRSL